VFYYPRKDFTEGLQVVHLSPDGFQCPAKLGSQVFFLVYMYFRLTQFLVRRLCLPDGL